MFARVISWSRRRDRQSVLFYRNFQGYTGGHQKVADYFRHCQLRPGLSPAISFSENSVWDATNPWFRAGVQVSEFTPNAYDVLFLAGLDWHRYRQSGIDPQLPVINLIQGVRHADPQSDVYPFLAERALRVCVSQEVADAIRLTGRVNGPVITIPNGHDIPQRPLPRQHDVFILGVKQPELARLLARQLARQLPTLSVAAIYDQTPRARLLTFMASSRVSVVLPYPTEGFYLPALESMALSDMTVVPDCVGNRSFCFDNVNCLMPALELEALTAAVKRALVISNDRIRTRDFRQAAQKQLKKHSLQRERQQFYSLLDDLPALWRQV